MLFLDAVKGAVSVIYVKYIVVCIDEANKMDGRTFWNPFHLDFVIPLNQFNTIQHDLPEITLQYVLSSCSNKVSGRITLP